MAGVLEDQKGDGVQAMGSFNGGEGNAFSSVDDDVDVKFYEDDGMTVRSNSLDGFQEIDGEGPEYDPDSSITRMDGNNDIAKWGD
jgi:hypothetical protein